MSLQFFLFVIAILLVGIFWVLSKIHTLLKKAVGTRMDGVVNASKPIAA